MKRSNACSTRMIQTAKSAALALAIAISPNLTWAQEPATTPTNAEQKTSSESKPPLEKPATATSDTKKSPADKTTKSKPSQPVEKKETTHKTSTPKPETTLPDQSDAFTQIQLFTRVLELVRQSYVDPDKTTYKKLISSALEGMLADLDPHSQFMHAKVFEQLKKNTGSTYEGVGITISFRNEVLSIVTVREDGPAARANVLPGDQILKINNFRIKNVGLSEAVALLKGKPGEKLKLTLRRPATKKVFAVEMVREIIRQKTVKDIRLLDKKITGSQKIGYARILQFSQPTAEEFSAALDQLEKQGMQAFILDLRNNPGGLLHSAISVCGEFVPADTLVLTTEARDGLGIIKPYRTPTNKHHDRNYPVAILLNHSSASASEVVAGALQDLNRAIIIGETSFGKGSVQSIIPVGSGTTAVRLTTAKYYTPSHRTIHENGVKPNIVSALTSEEERQLMRWWRRDSLSSDERKKAEKFQDRQLHRAIDSMKGALVYAKRERASDTKAAAETSAKKSSENKAADPKPETQGKVSPVKKSPDQTPNPSPKKNQPNTAKKQ